MKKIFIIAVICLSGVLMLTSCDKKTAAGKQPAGITASDVDSMSFMIGYSFGMQLQQNDMGPLSVNQMIKGILAACKGVEIDYMQFQTVVNGFMEKRSQALSSEMVKRSLDYLAGIEKKKGVMKTESGLLYEIVREGEGVKPIERDTVVVDYEGTNLDGIVFDSSYERGEPAEFPLDRVIKGWTEGMQLVGEGGMIMLYIPAELAYGERAASADIRPNEALTFKVELRSVSPYVAPAED